MANSKTFMFDGKPLYSQGWGDYLGRKEFSYMSDFGHVKTELQDVDKVLANFSTWVVADTDALIVESDALKADLTLYRTYVSTWLTEIEEEDSVCPHCAGTMTWCVSCKVWSSDCCNPWGSCSCS